MRERAKSDLYWLAAKVLGFEQILPMRPESHMAVCRFAERRTGIPEVDNCRVQLIQMPRGTGKSLLVTQCRTIQRLLQDRNWAAAIANETTSGAKAFLAAIKTQLEQNEFLRALFPELIPDFQQTIWAADQIIINRTNPNPANPSVFAAGVGRAVTGKHQDEWIVDDLISDEAMENARADAWTEIDKANRWIDRLKFLLNDYTTGTLTYIGTPWWPGDCYDYIREKYGHGERKEEFDWTLDIGHGHQQQHVITRRGDLVELRIPGIRNGRAFFPNKWPLDEIQRLKRDPNSTWMFQSQIMLNPVTDATTNFKKEWLRPFSWENEHKTQLRFTNDDERIEFARTNTLGTLMSIDPAISDKATAARSAIVVTGSDGERIFLLEAWAKRVGVSDLARKALDLYRDYRPTRIIVENVGYQMALAEVLRLEAEKAQVGALPIYEYKTGSDQKKPMRIAGLEAFFREGLIYYEPSQEEFLQEYMNFSSDVGSRLVDILDALSFQRESWDDLSFLSGESRDARKEAGKRARQRLREKYSRNRRRTLTHDRR